jgi:hypothetical protein
VVELRVSEPLYAEHKALLIFVAIIILGGTTVMAIDRFGPQRTEPACVPLPDASEALP